MRVEADLAALAIALVLIGLWELAELVLNFSWRWRAHA
jgi:hypothetical protein